MTSEFIWEDATNFAIEWKTQAICLLVGYVPFIFGLQYIMRYMGPFDLKLSLRLWNLSLSMLSLYGFGILFQRLFYVSFIHSITSLDYSYGITGYVVFLFNLVNHSV